MRKIEPIFKWICLVLTAMIIYMAAYNWRDNRYETEALRSRTLATALSQVNNLLDRNQSKIIHQINGILTSTGYSQLIRKLEEKDE